MDPAYDPAQDVSIMRKIQVAWQGATMGKVKKPRGAAQKVSAILSECEPQIIKVVNASTLLDVDAAWGVLLSLLAQKAGIGKSQVEGVLLARANSLAEGAVEASRAQSLSVHPLYTTLCKAIKKFDSFGPQRASHNQKRQFARVLQFGQHSKLEDLVNGGKFSVHRIEFDENSDTRFKTCTQRTWLIDVSGGGKPHKVDRQCKQFKVGGDKWMVLDANSSHIVLNQKGQLELIAVRNATSSPELLAEMSETIKKHVGERRDLRPTHPGSLYAFGISAGARHCRKFGHTKFTKQSKYSESELHESDQDLLGLASLAWALVMSRLPVEIIKEFADGLKDSGVPSLFSPSIESGFLAIVILPILTGYLDYVHHAQSDLGVLTMVQTLLIHIQAAYEAALKDGYEAKPIFTWEGVDIDPNVGSDLPGGGGFLHTPFTLD
ncbi:uncharacterized protein EI90DRAFT_3021879 [Cantharellus anzutake]|uniref:uncharacterized protein n=1 Tax=Cantharellus anzutake TaxID=1750568 RepID=UPI0019062DC5|nr:uncharacterized protein EI90DRAFT_3021879 [Cantharellus anzutake]KAF8315535.1 hypothetical protein EI90DRAFT_3021879 [Cantharellus anzutake]